MITTYIFILCLSAWIMALLLLRVGGKVASVLGNREIVSAGLVFAAISIAFLIVAAAPGSLLVGAVLLIVAPFLSRHGYAAPFVQWALPLLAAALAAAPVAMPAIPNVPSLMLHFTAIAALYGLVVAAPHLPATPSKFASGLLIVLAPLIAAPLLGAQSYIALDIAIIASSLLGVLMVLPAGASFAIARQPIALLAGWLILQSAVQGAWIVAAASLVALAGVFAYGLAHPDRTPHPHAP